MRYISAPSWRPKSSSITDISRSSSAACCRTSIHVLRSSRSVIMLCRQRFFHLSNAYAYEQARCRTSIHVLRNKAGL